MLLQVRLRHSSLEDLALHILHPVDGRLLRDHVLDALLLLLWGDQNKRARATASLGPTLTDSL